MAKRIAKHKMVVLSDEQVAELREVRKEIEAERPQITKLALKAKREYEAAQAELTRAAELLRAEREKQGLSLADMQQRSGLGRAAICRLENLVDANPTIGTLDRIAEALGKRLVIGLEDR
jgi:hypothetical protein